MLKFKKLFTFDDPFISSASGLIKKEDHFYVVSDDETSLLSIPCTFQGVIKKIKLRQDELPFDEKERKKVKPDFESLLILPKGKGILCVPSGSTENRKKAVLILDDDTTREISLNHIYRHLEQIIPELNIEGATTFESKIRLFQRGNGKSHQNGFIDLELDDFLHDQPKSVKWTPVDLGQLKGVPLSFTDGFFYQSLFWFLAVAEDSESTYEDGAFLGSILGRMDREGKIIGTKEMDIPFKPEGLYIENEEAFIVTDADNRSLPSALYHATI
jgi:hypothetical protein